MRSGSCVFLAVGLALVYHGVAITDIVSLTFDLSFHFLLHISS